MNTSIGMKMPRFHGRRSEDYGPWRHRSRAARLVKGVWPFVESNYTFSDAAASSETSPVQFEKISARLAKVSGILISALSDAPIRVLLDMDGEPDALLSLLDSRYACSRTVSKIAVQTQLSRMSYTGQNLSACIDEYTPLFHKLDRISPYSRKS